MPVPTGGDLGSQVLAGADGSPLQHVRRNNRLSYFLWGADAAATGAKGAQTTFFYCLPLDDEIYAARFCFARHPGGANVTITGAAFVVSTAVNDYVNPVGGGAATTVTWNAAGADYDVPDPYLAVPLTSRTIPPTPAADPLYGSVAWQPDWTDWKGVVPVAPALGGKRFLFLRVLFPNQPFYRPTRNTAAWTGNTGVNLGNDLSIRSVSGDSLTGFPTNVVGTAVDGFHPLIGYQVLSRSAGITVMACGDSKHQDTTTGAINGWLNQLWCQQPASHPGTILAPANLSWGAVTSATYGATALWMLDAIEPQIVFIQAQSGNDAVGAWQNLTIPRALAVARRVALKGGITVLMGPYADTIQYAGGNPTVQADVRAARTAILAATGSGILTLDPMGVLGARIATAGGTQALTLGYQSGLSTDNLHPNDAGNAALAAVARQIIDGVQGTT